MPNIMQDLVIDRVDFVDEGADTAAFIRLFKRKEQDDPMTLEEILSKMKPEHADVIQAAINGANEEVSKLRDELAIANGNIDELNVKLNQANEDLSKAKEPAKCECGADLDEEGKCTVCGKSASFDETEVLKSMPEAAREIFAKMREQKEAAEEQVRKAHEEKLHSEAVAKAATLKALPVSQDMLVGIIKSADQVVIDVLSAAAAAIEGTVLDEVGKAAPMTHSGDDAWSRIEAEADKVAKRDNVTKQKAISIVIKEQPELYNEYLKGDAT